MRRNLKVIIFTSLLSFLGFSLGMAQYDFSEAGIMMGLGGSLPIGTSQLQPGLGFGAEGFWSHYVCGKRYGYHAVVGGQYMSTSVEGSLVAVPHNFTTGDQFRFAYANAGFYLKVRKNEFHSDDEFALLVGPKVAVKALGLMTENGTTSSITKENYLSAGPVLPGAHFSFWVRKKLGKISLFLDPGVDAYFLPSLKAGASEAIFIYPYLNVGIAVWDSKRNKFRN